MNLYLCENMENSCIYKSGHNQISIILFKFLYLLILKFPSSDP